VCILFQKRLKLSRKVHECKPLTDGLGIVPGAANPGGGAGGYGRGLHSSTFRLNVSAFWEMGGHSGVA